jgi:hypothetical protein
MKEKNAKEAIARAVGDRVKKERAQMAGRRKEETGGEPDRDSPYFLRDGYLCRSKVTRDGGETTIRLCNFTAEIEEENILDDGKDTEHLFVIGGKLRGKAPLPVLEIPANTFPGMSWLYRWGSKACLEPGQTDKDCVRHAIQIASSDSKVNTHFAHTGWREINGGMVYLHAGGSIGGPDGVSVKLPRELERFRLPPKPPNTT